jgi:hypothetical protein
MTRENTQRMHIFGAPQAGGLVIRSTRKIVTERTEFHIPYRIVVSLVAYEIRECIQGPQANSSVRGRGQEEPIIGTERLTVDRSTVANQVLVDASLFLPEFVQMDT